MKVRVDLARCVGHGRCYVLAPDVFEEDERGHCVVVREHVPDAQVDEARRGSHNCPEGAIEVED